MKIFPPKTMPTSVEKIFEEARSQLDALRKTKPQELVAVKSRMGGHEMCLRDVPEGEEFKIIRK